MIEKDNKTKEQLLAENEELRLRLEEAEDTLRAIRSGEVDALVVSGPEGEQIFTLKGAERPYRVIIETMNEGAVILAPDGTIRYSNNRFAGILKTSIEKLVSFSIYGFVPPISGETFDAIFQEGKMGNCQGEILLKTEDGELVPVYLSVNYLDMDGAPSVCMVVTDLTELRQTKDKLNKADYIIEHAGFGVAIVNSEENTYEFVNFAYARQHGYTEGELIGMPVTLVYPLESRPAMMEKISLINEKGSYVFEVDHLRKNGAVFPVLINASVIRDHTGKVQKRVVFTQDISELKEKENALIESEARLKHLSSKLVDAHEEERKRIAHELHDSLGQYLTTIKLKAETVLKIMQTTVDKTITESLETLNSYIGMSIQETRRIQLALRPSILDDLGILAALSWLKREFQETHPAIHIQDEIKIEEIQVPDHLKTVIFRISQEALNNIAKHSKAGLVRFRFQKNDETIELAIQDEGQGFDIEEMLSLKSPIRGLGLTSMRERAELSGGCFLIESVKGKGTNILVSWQI